MGSTLFRNLGGLSNDLATLGRHNNNNNNNNILLNHLSLVYIHFFIRYNLLSMLCSFFVNNNNNIG